MKHIYFTETMRNGGHEIPEAERVTLRSKVYAEYTRHYPSGAKHFIKVWSTKENKMIDIRADWSDIIVID